MITDIIIALVFLAAAGTAVTFILRRPAHRARPLPEPEPGGGVLEAARPPGTVTVRREDLDYLLGHYWDEVLGHPDRSHWRLPLLQAAVKRMAEASWQQLSSGEPKD